MSFQKIFQSSENLAVAVGVAIRTPSTLFLHRPHRRFNS